MNIINIIIELITCPFSILFRSNFSGSNFCRFAGRIIVFLLSLVIVVVLLLLAYREQIFSS